MFKQCYAREKLVVQGGLERKKRWDAKKGFCVAEEHVGAFLEKKGRFFALRAPMWGGNVVGR